MKKKILYLFLFLPIILLAQTRTKQVKVSPPIQGIVATNLHDVLIELKAGINNINITGGNAIDSLNLSQFPTTSSAVYNAIGALNIRSPYLNSVKFKTQYNSLDVSGNEDFIISKKHGNLEGNNILLVKDISTGFFSNLFSLENRHYFLLFSSDGVNVLSGFHFSTQVSAISVTGYKVYSIINDAGYSLLPNVSTAVTTSLYFTMTSDFSSGSGVGTDDQNASEVSNTAVNGNTNVQDVLNDHETRIDVLAAGGSDGNDFVSSMSITGDVLSLNVPNQTNPSLSLSAWINSKNFSTGSHFTWDFDYNDLANTPVIPNASDYVTIATNQSITGSKTFSGNSYTFFSNTNHSQIDMSNASTGRGFVFGAGSNANFFAKANTGFDFRVNGNTAKDFSIDANGVTKFSALEGTGTNMVVSNANGEISTQPIQGGAVSYDLYACRFSQSGTQAPTATIFESNAIVWVWTREAVGVYRITPTGAYNHLRILININQINGTQNNKTIKVSPTPTYIQIASFDNGVLSDDRLSGTIELKQY